LLLNWFLATWELKKAGSGIPCVSLIPGPFIGLFAHGANYCNLGLKSNRGFHFRSGLAKLIPTNRSLAPWLWILFALLLVSFQSLYFNLLFKRLSHFQPFGGRLREFRGYSF